MQAMSACGWSCSCRIASGSAVYPRRLARSRVPSTDRCRERALLMPALDPILGLVEQIVRVALETPALRALIPGFECASEAHAHACTPP